MQIRISYQIGSARERVWFMPINVFIRVVSCRILIQQNSGQRKLEALTARLHLTIISEFIRSPRNGRCAKSTAVRTRLQINKLIKARVLEIKLSAPQYIRSAVMSSYE